ncbi:hypothetical protein [Pseudorhodoplanes sinuspersici]|uniref:Uncharacterized protein n=1 Tax=Pseudorhodoplanes sinuspersici TaxID=1235591 RepID=A0A1W6ZSE3_9HYPH|nr:hypothetical protein [Pseudorhodoplanes sinuspersici]ARQ00198.1 hypothetical protein CAK95_14775 [Pseudorhodoplanes sinuspersici]RKE67662.1 hypothetical protein DFP91_5429 [Pseudorhodoplanes sinuspersici]
MSYSQDVIRIETLDLSLGEYDWGFARERSAEIAAHFEAAQKQKPALWNGRVLLMHKREIADAILRGQYFETDFANFMALRDFGFPDRSVANCFALGVLQGSDGGYVLGIMGGHTMNAGKIYFPGGTPDPSDLVGSRVDLELSVRREVQEETGLAPSDFDIDAGWHCVPGQSLIALLKPMRARETAEQLRARIMDHIASEEEPELAGAAIVRSLADLNDKMPAFVQTFFRTIYF